MYQLIATSGFSRIPWYPFIILICLICAKSMEVKQTPGSLAWRVLGHPHILQPGWSTRCENPPESRDLSDRRGSLEPLWQLVAARANDNDLARKPLLFPVPQDLQHPVHVENSSSDRDQDQNVDRFQFQIPDVPGIASPVRDPPENLGDVHSSPDRAEYTCVLLVSNAYHSHFDLWLPWLDFYAFSAILALSGLSTFCNNLNLGFGILLNIEIEI